ILGTILRARQAERRRLRQLRRVERRSKSAKRRRDMRKRAIWSLSRSSEWWDNCVPRYMEAQWLKHFRMFEETFIFLCNKLRPALQRKDTFLYDCVPLRKIVAIALWKFATRSDYRPISVLFGVGISTVAKCVKDFCAAAEALLLPELIHLPDEGKFREIASYFESRWGLPQCVGAIDAVVDGKGLFWNVFAGLPGSMHDARVLRLSSIWDLASCGNLFPDHSIQMADVDFGYCILGDSAYPLQDWLLTPFTDTGRACAVVENAFGRLKGRWRCLLKRNDCVVSLVRSMILTCCALHNLCESHGENYDNVWTTETEYPEPVAAPPPPHNTGDVGGKAKRDALMMHLLGQ
uniref:DDE Tnp4 domain-containing protein n=1 Tax=Nothobranchius furzeri TaxID=105023 RepID=A0A8C6NRQ5_NOTFU